MPHTAPPQTLPDLPDLLGQEGVAWRVERAGRAACLIDAAAYYGTLRRALLSARRQVLILGWDVDGRTRLTGEDEPEDDAPRTLRDFLAWLVQQRPDLHIHILLWDYTLLYSLDREPLPKVSLGWTTPDRVHLHLDNRIPIAASHHEKIVVIDDALAFCGGMDLSVRRWDTPEHRPDDPRRRDPGGSAYAPVHDVQMMVTGPAAAALGDLCRERWRRARRRRLAAPEPGPGPLWPAGYEAAFRDGRIAVSRTRPHRRQRRPVCEIRTLYQAAIAHAERFIVIENQYLTADAIAEALADRLRRNPRLEVLLIGPRTAMDWLEETTMGVGRAAFMARLAASGAGDRVRLLAPVVRDGDGRDHDVKVHSKLMVVDDRLLTVGSANLANRSMGLDSETNLTLTADRPDHAAAITTLRRRLLAEHAGVTVEDVAAAESASGGRLFAAVDRLVRRDPCRDLVPVAAEAVEADGSVVLLNRLGDPEEPLDLERVLAEQVPPPPDHPRRRRLRHLWTGLVLVAVLAAGVALWTFTPLREGLNPDVFLQWAERMRGTPWTPLAVLAAYVVLGLIAFPITVLITVTAMVFGPWLGFLYAGIGAITAAVVTFWVGHVLGRKLVQRYAGRGVNRMSKALGDRGIVAVVFLRVAPVAPFVLINLVAGASHVRFRDYLTGTVIGMLPGIAVMTLLGSSIMDLIHSPSPGRIALLVGCLALWLAVSIGLQRLVARRRQASGDADGDDES
ncbi:VTT domain-containing protein [Caenispirillum bisanense]|uniref:VTT domain-containing protein n=1 Tax=Caenispirillum bisanense TaxID=414052 RepID=UPI0031D99069